VSAEDPQRSCVLRGAYSHSTGGRALLALAGPRGGRKADHVVCLCARAGLRPQTVLVGCGDGGAARQLAGRGFGSR
jgi:hypothetical protein